MVCPYLDYRRAAGELEFDEERAYCNAAEQFVQPMRADVCNDRYALDHAIDCEIYREHAPADDLPVPDDRAAPTGTDGGSGEGGE